MTNYGLGGPALPGSLPRAGLEVHIRLDLPALAGQVQGHIYPDFLLNDAIEGVRRQIASGVLFGEVSTHTTALDGSYTDISYGTWEVTTSDGEPIDDDVFAAVLGECDELSRVAV